MLLNRWHGNKRASVRTIHRTVQRWKYSRDDLAQGVKHLHLSYQFVGQQHAFLDPEQRQHGVRKVFHDFELVDLGDRDVELQPLLGVHRRAGEGLKVQEYLVVLLPKPSVASEKDRALQRRQRRVLPAWGSGRRPSSDKTRRPCRSEDARQQVARRGTCAGPSFLPSGTCRALRSYILNLRPSSGPPSRPCSDWCAVLPQQKPSPLYTPRSIIALAMGHLPASLVFFWKNAPKLRQISGANETTSSFSYRNGWKT